MDFTAIRNLVERQEMDFTAIRNLVERQIARNAEGVEKLVA